MENVLKINDVQRLKIHPPLLHVSQVDILQHLSACAVCACICEFLCVRLLAQPIY